ncbi:nuclear transport factor 2 family protein [Chitinophaga oryzae]|uniref:Nuclear transport factor 2 family protein n=1 Tax=Chitinophaga oryzae TaxID=2725414 RepID=A0AAE7D639_9BACT|nr:nuclear transport factor 2 family protein [Chitinophaga oryzae]QJB30749.1 nuclear transport factor 2 family protein [Chitinophaga oryzae]
METIVSSFFKAMAERNLNDILRLIADDIDWYIPGNETLVPWLGRRSTKAEVGQVYTLLWQNTTPISADIFQSMTQGNVNLTSGRFKVKMLPTGHVYESIFFTEITVANNLIVKYRLLEEGYGLVIALQDMKTKITLH